jgi:hypothetical protein
VTVTPVIAKAPGVNGISTDDFVDERSVVDPIQRTGGVDHLNSLWPGRGNARIDINRQWLRTGTIKIQRVSSAATERLGDGVVPPGSFKLVRVVSAAAFQQLTVRSTDQYVIAASGLCSQSSHGTGDENLLSRLGFDRDQIGRCKAGDSRSIWQNSRGKIAHIDSHGCRSRRSVRVQQLQAAGMTRRTLQSFYLSTIQKDGFDRVGS